MWLFQVDRVAAVISPVMAEGFLTGCAVMVIVSQLPSVFGSGAKTSKDLFGTPLVIIATAVSHFLQLDTKHNVKVVGNITSGYSVKLVTQRPADRNRDDVKHSRKLYAQWLQSDGPRMCRFYLDETNYNIWCSRNFGRAAKGQPAVHTTTTTKGANLNIMACMSANGVIHWTAVDRVHWAVFDDFLSDVSACVESEEPNTEAVFIFDGAPAHARAEQAALANSMHSIKHLPACSPFFNPIEEVFSKFKSHVKAYLSERPDLVLATPQGMTKKEHRRSLLLDAARHSMQQIQCVDCAAFDRHNFSFVPAALREDDL
ncbi:hypothetical protein HPB52_013267 [Rhipicephalus sanguineus]|uniref:Tc1-like transposase DDE domain-containing protein n=1 Tax=Rhipicephalus sanguineus TaxID=34632 RepID=A0A9D4QAN7_RHISA|nr:hypothetical protein HPB52_013267 [Rhipicephalus sanguineus]